MSVIKYNNNNINDWNFGTSNVIKVYRNNAVCFYKVVGDTPSGQTPCFAVVDDISQYQSTEFVDVYDKATSKWYKRNNLNQYEEYGVYGNSTASTETYYDGKLAVVNGYEYEFTNGSWVNVGEVSGGETTFSINTTTASDYNGQELKTTFKIPKSDVDALGWFSMDISTQDGGTLSIGTSSYSYNWSENGTITDDGTYYYYSLPTTQSVIISSISCYNTDTIHIIFDGMVPPIEYESKDRPDFTEVFASVEDRDEYQCPFVGQYGVIGTDVYRFEQDNTWVIDNTTKLKAFYNDGTANVLDCSNNTTLSSGDTKPSYLDYTHMTNVEIGDCVTSIGNNAFQYCSGLTSIEIPSGITSIGQWAFSDCRRLTSIEIPSGVTSIGSSTFYYCGSLTSITIPSGVTSIGDSAFGSCSGLTNITIPSGVTSIGNSAFINCRGLTSITIPNGVTSIGGSTFQSCYGLTSVNIQSGVTSIGSSAFRNCSGLTSITIPSGVTSIGAYAFRNCSGLTSVTVEATTPPTLSTAAFDGTNDCPIYVPCNSLNAYKSASRWSTYASRIEGFGDCEPQYEELDYIERNASYSGYIPSLGVTLKSNTVFEIQFKPTSTNAGGLILGESNSPSDNDDYRIFFYSTRMYYDYGSKRINKSMSSNTMYTFQVGNYYVRSGSTFSSNVMSSTTQSSSVATSHTRNIELFDANSQDYALIYYLKVYEGGTLVKDFIPVRMNGIATLLDTLTNTPLTVNGVLKGSDET